MTLHTRTVPSVPTPAPGTGDHPAYAQMLAVHAQTGQPAAYTGDLTEFDRATLMALDPTQEFIWVTRPAGTYLIWNAADEARTILEHALSQSGARAYRHEAGRLAPCTPAGAREVFARLPGVYYTRKVNTYGFDEYHLMRDHFSGPRYVTLHGADRALYDAERREEAPERSRDFQLKAAQTYARLSRLA